MALPKPSTHLNWTDGAASKVLEPSVGKKLLGWLTSERPPFRFFNWLFFRTDEWIKYLESVQDELAFSIPTYDAYIGTGGQATHASILDANNDAGFPVGGRMLVLEDFTVDVIQQITKNDVEVQFKTGVTYTQGAAADGLRISATGCKITFGRFASFDPGRAIVFDAPSLYGTVFNCRFAGNETDIDDLSLTAKLIGIITE